MKKRLISILAAIFTMAALACSGGEETATQIPAEPPTRTSPAATSAQTAPTAAAAPQTTATETPQTPPQATQAAAPTATPGPTATPPIPTPTPSPTPDPILAYVQSQPTGQGAIHLRELDNLESLAGDGAELQHLEEFRWIFESDYYRRLADKANLTSPTEYVPGESLEISMECIRGDYPQCDLLESYFAQNVARRTGGQVTIKVVRGETEQATDVQEIIPERYEREPLIPYFVIHGLHGAYVDQEHIFAVHQNVAEDIDGQLAETGHHPIMRNWNFAADIWLFYNQEAIRSSLQSYGFRDYVVDDPDKVGIVGYPEPETSRMFTTIRGISVNRGWNRSDQSQLTFSREQIKERFIEGRTTLGTGEEYTGIYFSLGEIDWEITRHRHITHVAGYLVGNATVAHNDGWVKKWIEREPVEMEVELEDIEYNPTFEAQFYAQFDQIDTMSGPIPDIEISLNAVNTETWREIRENPSLWSILVEEGAKYELEALRLAPTRTITVNETLMGLIRNEPHSLEVDANHTNRMVLGWDFYAMENHDDIPAWFNEKVGPFIGMELTERHVDREEGTVRIRSSLDRVPITEGPYAGREWLKDRNRLIPTPETGRQD